MRCSARRGEARQLQVLLGGSAAMLVMLAVSSYQSYGGSSGAAALPQASRRELESLEELRQERELQASNQTSVKVKVETKCSGDFGKLQGWELRGGLVLHLVATLYVFLGIAIVCDDFFVEALERISSALKLSDDVAGATFMAAGSSAPELAVAVVSTLLASEPGDEGLGTIVGSAVFNIMVIVGVTAIFAGQVLDITPYPFARDCCFYTLSIAMLVAFVYDGKVGLRARVRIRAHPDPNPKPKPKPNPISIPIPIPNATTARWRCGSPLFCCSATPYTSPSWSRMKRWPTGSRGGGSVASGSPPVAARWPVACRRAPTSRRPL